MLESGPGRAVLAHRDFRSYAAGRFLATLAIQMQGLAIGFQVYDLTHSKIALGGATAVLPVYATDILHVGPLGLGVMRGASSVGAGLTAAYLALRPPGRRAGPRMLAGVAVFGVAMVVFGLSRSFGLSVAMLALSGAANMVSVVVGATLIQAATPPAMRGRVSAVSAMFAGASSELGELESGALAEWLGPVSSVVLGGAGAVAAAVLCAWRFPGLGRVDRLEDVMPESVREPL